MSEKKHDVAAIRSVLAVALGRDERWLLVAAISATFLRTVGDLATAALLLLFLRALGVVTDAIPSWIPAWLANSGAVRVWMTLFVLVGAQAFLQVIGNWSKITLTEHAHLRMRMLLGQGLLPDDGAPLPLSKLGHLSSEVIPRATEFVFFGIQFVSFVIQTLILAAAIMYIAPAETLVGFTGLAVAGVFVYSFSGRARRASTRMMECNLRIEKTKSRAVRSWLLIRALRLQKLERANYAAACTEHYRASIESFVFANMGTAVTPVIGVVVLAAIALMRHQLFDTSAAAFAGFLYLFARFQHLVGNSANLIGGLFSSMPYVREAATLFAEVPPPGLQLNESAGQRPRDRQHPTSGATPPDMLARALVFVWPDDGRAVIDGLDFAVPAGGQLGITGPNGAGKTTLLALLLGVYAPQSGLLKLDGEPAAVWAARHAMNIGYVGPEACLHAGTVRDNLEYGLDGHRDDGELLAILHRAGFKAAPHVLEQVIGEDGEGLSSGEKQKLAIGRALLRRPALLFLDEPTANVDAKSEEEITETMRSLAGSCTLVVVSHQPAVLRHATAVIALGVSRERLDPSLV